MKKKIPLVQFCIAPSATIRKALEVLNEYGLQICCVVDQNGLLLGAVTDGDIRRGLLNGAELSQSVDKVMNTEPKFVKSGTKRSLVAKKMSELGVKQLPIVNAKVQVIDLELDQLVTNLNRTNHVVLMAGGFGKRLRPLTDDVPKPLLLVDGVPILEHTLVRFREKGFSKFTLSVNYMSEKVMAHFGDGVRWNVEISYLKEEKPMGTCGALSLLKYRPQEPFFVMNGDLLTQANFGHIMDFHVENEATATMCVREYAQQIPYGVVKLNGHEILSIEEKPNEVSHINAGIYVLSPEVLPFITENTFIDMPTLFMNLKNKNMKIISSVLKEYWLDIGRIEDFHKAQSDYEKYFRS